MRWKAFFARPILKVYRGFARNTADTDSADSGIQQAVVIGQGYTGRLGMSTSICYWVRQQLGIGEEEIPLVNSNGFQCLGYQSKLFSGR